MAQVPLMLKERLPHLKKGDSLNKTPHAQFPLPLTHTHARMLCNYCAHFLPPPSHPQSLMEV